MESATIGSRIRQVREQLGMTRAQFAERLGTTADEIRNIECDRLKRPDQKESFYRSVSAEFNISLDWIKTGAGEMRPTPPQDDTEALLDALLALHDPTFDAFVAFCRSHTPEERNAISYQLRSLVEMLERYGAEKNKD